MPTYQPTKRQGLVPRVRGRQWHQPEQNHRCSTLFAHRINGFGSSTDMLL